MLLLLYGFICYAAFVLTIICSVGFLGNFGLTATLDRGPVTPVGQAVGINVMLLLTFAVQHSLMARRVFKKALTRVIPPAIERSTYVLSASAAMLVLLLQWRPIMRPALWDIEWAPARVLLTAISLGGFAFTIYASFLINHFELFGLRQVWLHYKGRTYQPPRFSESRVYGYIRAPLMLGFLIAFWVAPTMTPGRLLLATMSTAYVLIAVRWEERDLAAVMGEEYERYRRSTPMLIPWLRR